MEILFAVLLDLLFLPKYECFMIEKFLPKVSIRSNGKVTCVNEMFLLLFILNKIFKTDKFNFVFLIHYIF